MSMKSPLLERMRTLGEWKQTQSNKYFDYPNITKL